MSGFMNVRRVATSLGVVTTLACASGAQADILPNPGGATVVTNSTTATIGYVDMPVTQQVNDYATTIAALLNGSPVFSQIFALPFSAPQVQSAVAAADAVLSGAGATFGTPALVSNSTVLQNSVMVPPVNPNYTCLTIPDLYRNGMNTVSSPVDTFGPASVPTGACQSQTFVVIAGQLNININTDIGYTVPLDVLTTDTYVTTQAYQITGTRPAGPASIPEPGTAALLLGCGVLFGLRRVRG